MWRDSEDVWDALQTPIRSAESRPPSPDDGRRVRVTDGVARRRVCHTTLTFTAVQVRSVFFCLFVCLLYSSFVVITQSSYCLTIPIGRERCFYYTNTRRFNVRSFHWFVSVQFKLELVLSRTVPAMGLSFVGRCYLRTRATACQEAKRYYLLFEFRH